MRTNLFLKDGHFRPLSILLLFLVPLFIAFICLGIGRLYIPYGDIISTFTNYIKGTNKADFTYITLVNLRLPRILMAIIIGAGLTCAGATFQSLFSNPLATPDILGVTSGTCFGAIIAIIFSFNMIEIQLLALAFGLLAVWITIKVAGKGDKSSIIVLVLAGLIISALFNAFGSLLKYLADPLDKLPEITYWLMGSFTGSTYKRILIGSPLILLGILIIFLLRWKLNILSLSEDEAKASGINIRALRIIFILAATFITASSVAMCGQIGWVGLLIPHSARMLVGSNNRYVIPVSISLGASFMLVIDTFARSISTIELPISILTAIIGAPLFISLLKSSRRSF